MPAPTSPEQRAAARADLARRRDEAVTLAAGGVTYEEVARRLGWNSAQAAHKAVKAALAERLKRQDLAVDELRAKHTALLDEALREARRIMHETHRAHSGGRLVYDDADQPMIDNGPVLAAVDRIVKISESQRKLWGIDAPARTESKVEVDGTVSYQVAVAPEELEQL